jgi:uncharacterized protein (TIGR02646 family)
MTPVAAVGEPATFDASVRAPGRDYLDSLTANEEAKTGEHPYWRRVLRELHTAYGGICAYTCHWIPYDVGNDTVEHFIPKSIYPSLAYEWSNYRLVCGRLNGRKRDFQDVVDPFDVVLGMFRLEFPSLLVSVGSNLTASQKSMAASTIMRLKLNEARSIDMRLHFVQHLVNGQITKQYVSQHAPFLSSEMDRLNLDVQRLGQLFG